MSPAWNPIGVVLSFLLYIYLMEEIGALSKHDHGHTIFFFVTITMLFIGAITLSAEFYQYVANF